MTTLKALVDETTNIKNDIVSCRDNLATSLIEKGIDVTNFKITNLQYNSSNWTTSGDLFIASLPYEFYSPPESLGAIHFDILNAETGAYVRHLYVYPGNTITLNVNAGEKLGNISFRNSSGWNGASSIPLIQSLFPPKSGGKMSTLIGKVNEIEIEKHNIPSFIKLSDFFQTNVTEKFTYGYNGTRVKSCVIGTKVYIIFPNHGNSASRIVTYDMENNVWGEEPVGLPMYVMEPSMCCDDRYIYITHTGYKDRNYKYDTVNKNISTIAPMPMDIRSSSTAIVDGVIYSIGGYINNNSFGTNVLAYDILTNTWTIKISASSSTNGNNYCYNIKNDVYSFGGIQNNTIFKYDTVLNTITALMNSTKNIIEGTVSNHNDIIYSFGYFVSNGWYRFGCKVDVLTKTSTAIADYLPQRRGGCGATYKDVIFLLCGYNTTTVTQGDVYII